MVDFKKKLRPLPSPAPDWVPPELDPKDWPGIFGDDKKKEEYVNRTRKQDLDNAQASGCTIVDREPDQLLIDIDTFQQETHLFTMLDRLNDAGMQLEIVDSWPSKSGLPHHWHYVLQDQDAFQDVEAIALQAILGSDPMREYMSLKRIWDGDPARASVLFRPQTNTTAEKVKE